MKKVIALLLTLMMILSLAACAAAPAKETNSETTAPAAQENTTETDVPNDVAPGAEYEGKSIQIMFNSDDTWNDVIDNYAKEHNESVTSFLNCAVDEAMARDSQK